MKKIYQNTQLYSECQLIALWNAARFHDVPVPEIGSEQYNKICEDSCCIIGACIDIRPELKRLKLKSVPGENKLNWIKKNIPVALPVIHKRRGFHAVLVVKANRNKLCLANYADGRLCWPLWNNIKKMIPKAPNNKVFGYRLRGESNSQ